MGVGDVEPHAARAGGADFDVDAGVGVDQAAVEELDVADQARHVESVEQTLGGPVPDLPRFEPPQDLLGRAEDVAVGDACRGVDAVDDDVGLRLGQDVVEDEGAEVRVVEAAELGPDQVALGALLEQPEEVAGRGGEHGRAGLGLELLGGLPRLLETQAVDLDLARPARQQLAADGHADEAVPSEHKDLPVLNIQRSSPYKREWNAGRGETLAGGDSSAEGGPSVGYNSFALCGRLPSEASPSVPLHFVEREGPEIQVGGIRQSASATFPLSAEWRGGQGV